MPASDAAFDATTADDWIYQIRKAEPPRPSFREVFVALFSSNYLLNDDFLLSNFTLRVLLEGLQSLAADVQEAESQPCIGTPSRAEISQALIRLYQKHLQGDESSSVDKMELLIRWHSIFLNLAAPSTALCRRMCVAYDIQQKLHGISREDLAGFDLVAWSQSSDALRAVLHALAIQDIVEKMPLGRSHAIHLPSAIFAVSTIYSARCIGGFPSISAPRNVSWETVWEVDLPGTARLNPLMTPNTNMKAFLSGDYPRSTPNAITKNLIYELNSLQITLNSISSRWGVSHEMDGVLQRWISIVNERHSSTV
jgi:hypothetical protein